MRLRPLLAISWLVLAVPAPVFAVGSYEACLALSDSDPARAREEASAWADNGGGRPARHCGCLASEKAGHYAEAAQCLERLADAHEPREAQAALLAQAGNAWILQHEGQKAYDDLTHALALTPDDPDMLLDRARAAVVAEDFRAAKEDLDRLMPRATGGFLAEALVLRANARRALGDRLGARSDGDAAVALAPGNAPARVERGIDRYLLGDAAGARTDWTAAVELAPNSSAALDAQALLQKDAQGALPGAKKAAP